MLLVSDDAGSDIPHRVDRRSHMAGVLGNDLPDRSAAAIDDRARKLGIWPSKCLRPSRPRGSAGTPNERSKLWKRYLQWDTSHAAQTDPNFRRGRHRSAFVRADREAEMARAYNAFASHLQN